MAGSCSSSLALSLAVLSATDSPLGIAPLATLDEAAPDGSRPQDVGPKGSRSSAALSTGTAPS
eukprot:6782485-Pyramimonas_sp.AAC.1